MGALVLVVGPSGAGKDTLIGAARAALAADNRFVFPRRVVTRQAVTALEDHDSVNEAEFARLLQNGAFAFSWRAHGLRYGLPASLVDDLSAGRVVIVNGSRAMVAMARQQFAGTRVVLVTASPEVRARRLAERGREQQREVAARLGREVPDPPSDAVVVDNSGALAEGISRFLAALEAIGRS